MNTDQLDRKMLRDMLSKLPLDKYEADKILLKAKDEQLWDSLACLNEPEFSSLRPLGLGRKIRVILEYRAQKKNSRILWWTLIGVILTLGATIAFGVLILLK